MHRHNLLFIKVGQSSRECYNYKIIQQKMVYRPLVCYHSKKLENRSRYSSTKPELPQAYGELGAVPTEVVRDEVELLIRCQEVLVSYVTHARAGLNPVGRLKLVQLVVDQGWTQARVAPKPHPHNKSTHPAEPCHNLVNQILALVERKERSTRGIQLEREQMALVVPKDITQQIQFSGE